MSTPIFVILLVLFVSAAIVILINITEDPGFDPWDLDGDSVPPPSKLDALRSWPVFYGAGAVLIGTFFVYLYMR